MSNPRYAKLVQELPSTVPFVGPETQERYRGSAFDARLGANENIFGPSPKAIAALNNAATDIWMYGDPTSFDLRHALSVHLGCSIGNVVVGEGIDGLMGYLVRLLVDAGDNVVTSDGAYPTFNYHVAGYGGTLHKVAYKDDKEDLPTLLSKAAEVDAKLVYFANPDNPMGSWTTGAEIEAALTNIPAGTVLLLDEAYVEFAPTNAVPSIDIEDPRVIRMRTFSKAYGMAGGRVGYAFGAADLITSFGKIRNHFGMNRAAQTAAIAALQDVDWLRKTIADVETSRRAISQIAADNGLVALPSATNFVTIDCGRDGDYARRVLGGLVAQGVFVRMPFVTPQDRCIRISAGREQDLEFVAAALPKALADA